MPQAEQPLKAWFADARTADWASPDMIGHHHASAGVLRGNRVVFNIGGDAETV
jgi:mRNA interferase HigB